ncbi:MAG: TlpA disulfide reductase family protein [Bacteroidales bacterium]|nr:TlpA disulfide reductase family protein [Bacteroidales bacterium]
MKKALLFSCVVAAAMASCGNSGYTVNGTIADTADGTYVYLYSGATRSARVVDSAKVENGAFRFQGNQQLAEMRTVSCGKQKAVIALENANLNLDMQGGVCSGSALNDVYAAYLAKEESVNAQLKALGGKVDAGDLTEEEAKAAWGKLIDELGAYELQVTRENIQNCVGVHLYRNVFYDLSDEENEALMAQIPERLKNETIAKFEQNIAVRRKTAVGQPFVDFTMNDPDGKAVSLGQYVRQNKYTLVDFWASWCGPCRAEMPNVVETYAKYKDKGFGIVGVSLDSDLDNWKKAIETLGITWPQMSDLKYWNCAGAAEYGVMSIPSTVLIGQDGTIVARDLRGEDMAKKLDELFGR